MYALGNAIWWLKIISNVYSSDSEVVMTTFLLMFLMKILSAGLDPLKSYNAARLVGLLAVSPAGHLHRDESHLRVIEI